MVEYRRITAEDVPVVAQFAIDGLPLPPGAGVRPSMEKVRAVVRHFSSSPSDFHLVAFDGRIVVGAIAACVNEMLFFERCEATVVMCQARGAPGVGRELIRRLVDWVDGEMRIRRVLFPVDASSRPGFARLLRSAGFVDLSRTFTHSKE